MLDMAERRKPTRVMLLKKQGKRAVKLELYPAKLWSAKFFRIQKRAGRFRIRVNGKWYAARKGGDPTCHTPYEIRDLIWKSLSVVGYWN